MTTDDAELRREGERIAQLIDDLATIGGEPVRERAEELVRRLIHLYGAGLAALMQIFGDRLDDSAKARVTADPLVSSLLLLHGVHPDPGAARALDPGPEREPPTSQQPVAGLIQIDLSHGRGAKTSDRP
ncbi:MAG TPA: hypothetical protein VH853_16635 [Polyangia bacterium]|jgi:hypothetical protein|nr:hypothetical protein [Polyangia bacterium]